MAESGIASRVASRVACYAGYRDEEPPEHHLLKNQARKLKTILNRSIEVTGI
jgi:hypothetical protein